MGFFKNNQEILAFAPLQFSLGEKFRFGVARCPRRPARGTQRGSAAGKSKSNARPLEMMTARSITFRNSRMLPGQW